MIVAKGMLLLRKLQLKVVEAVGCQVEGGTCLEDHSCCAPEDAEATEEIDAHEGHDHESHEGHDHE